MRKRTITLNGHQTSLAIEEEFWDALTEMAEAKLTSWHKLVAQIDQDREAGNLASAVRLAILDHYRHLATQAIAVDEPELESPA